MNSSETPSVRKAGRILRASEIGAYLFCQRSWWYRKRGFEPENKAELSSGQELHYRHGQAVLASGCLRALAYAIMLLALVVLAVYLAGRLG